MMGVIDSADEKEAEDSCINVQIPTKEK